MSTIQTHNTVAKLDKLLHDSFVRDDRPVVATVVATPISFLLLLFFLQIPRDP